EFDFSKVASLPAGSQSYVDSSVLEGVTYCYRIRAYTDAGQSPYSGEACASVPVAAAVKQPVFMLWVTKAGSGNGGIGSGGTELCGWKCTATFFPPGGVITLTAVPAPGSTFVGWSGGCSGTGPCTVIGNTAVAVTATFNRM